LKWTTGGLAVLGMGLGLVLGGAWWRHGAEVSLPAVPDAAAPAHTAPVDSASPIGPGWLSADLPAPAAAPVEALAARIARLAASQAPLDAYRAWWLLHACTEFRKSGILPDAQTADEAGIREPIADPAAFCAGMTERMKMARVDYLERAARGGIDAALAALVEEGPFGDPSALRTRPGDPLVKEWKERVNGLLGGQAEQGYWSSLYVLFTGFWFENPAIAADRASALAYGMALRDIMVKLDGVAEQDAIPFNGPFLDAIGTGLSQDQVAQARARAAAIVDKAAAQRARAKP
jgi:hypothetical protein